MSDAKRLVDLSVSAAALVALAPLFGVLAVLIKLDSPGPVFFRQRRIGRGTRPFLLLKFRSMVANAPELGPWSTSPGDSRITRIGSFLRRTSLDELPQLLNVVRGDMSLVGPRPDVPEQMGLYTDEERTLRHRVRPGITGWSQAAFRHEGSGELRKRYDLEYARRSSLRLDFQILWATLRHLATGRPAGRDCPCGGAGRG